MLGSRFSFGKSMKIEIMKHIFTLKYSKICFINKLNSNFNCKTRNYHKITRFLTETLASIPSVRKRIPLINELVNEKPSNRSIPPKFSEYEKLGIDEQYRLAILHLNTPIPGQLESWGVGALRHLVNKNYVPAFYSLGVLIRNSEVSDRPEIAIEYISRAASHKGMPWAKACLGKIYIEGWNIEKDLRLGVKYLEDAWNDRDERTLASIPYTVPIDMYDAYLKLGSESLAVHWIREGVRLNILQAQYNMGVILHNGLYGQAKNDVLAADHWLTASAKGFALAQHNLGTLYMTGGENIPINYEAGAYFFYLAHMQDFYYSSFNLALLYALGKGVPKNIALSMEILIDICNYGGQELAEQANLFKEKLINNRITEKEFLEALKLT